MINVTHYSGDKFGGAGIAAIRIHNALKRRIGDNINSSLVVPEKYSDDSTVAEVNTGTNNKIRAIINPYFDMLPMKLSKLRHTMPQSVAWTSSLKARRINSTPSDIAHLHWINSSFLSIEEIGRITKPIVWTMHDMWAFCGTEHISDDTANSRWKTGYGKSSNIDGFDVDRWVWRRKLKNWKESMYIVTPSRWLYDCVLQSALMRNFTAQVIPNPLDVNVYKPISKTVARQLHNLPFDRKLILFGAIKGTQLTHKGWDLLMPALAEVANRCKQVDVVVFGQGRPANPPKLPMKIHWMGHLRDDVALSALYSAADLLVVPSRIESFCQTASEAQACGCPVVSFNSTGLKDVVEDGLTGIRISNFNSNELFRGIMEVLGNPQLMHSMGVNARERATRLWSYDVVSKMYAELYKNVLDGYQGRQKHE